VQPQKREPANHGKQRWAEKNDPAQPPTDASAIQAVTPSDIFNWQGPTEYLVPSSERIWSEQKWYALTGRVVDFGPPLARAACAKGDFTDFTKTLTGFLWDLGSMFTRGSSKKSP